MERFPWWLKGSIYQQCRICRRWKFDPWVRKIPWRRKWQPTPVFLPGKFHGQGSLTVYSVGSQRIGHNQAHTCNMYGNHWGVGGSGEYRPTTMDWYIFAHKGTPGVGNKGRSLTTWDRPHGHGVDIYPWYRELGKTIMELYTAEHTQGYQCFDKPEEFIWPMIQLRMTQYSQYFIYKMINYHLPIKTKLK